VTDLAPAVTTIVRECLAVQPGEDVLVIADETTGDLAQALAGEAAAAGADPVLAVMAQRASHGAEPPPSLAAALLETAVFIAPTAKSLSHTRARARASQAGARGATMPGVTAPLLARVMDVDLAALGRRSRAVAARLDGASEALLTCPAGTHLHIDLSGRRGIADDGDLSRAGAFGNLPCGEGFIAPAGGEGTLVASSLAAVGLAEPPARLTVREGRLAGAEGPEAEAFAARLAEHGRAGGNLAELGVGTNDRARLTGNVLEDEKIMGTVHVAFGASAAIGGTVSVPVHLDCVVLDPTLVLDGQVVVEAGRLLEP
jgi:leucyl aminopeptidase (aminopeptidase T)